MQHGKRTVLQFTIDQIFTDNFLETFVVPLITYPKTTLRSLAPIGPRISHLALPGQHRYLTRNRAQYQIRVRQEITVTNESQAQETGIPHPAKQSLIPIGKRIAEPRSTSIIHLCRSVHAPRKSISYASAGDLGSRSGLDLD